MTQPTLEYVHPHDITAFLERQQDEYEHVDLAPLPTTQSSKEIITQTLI